MAKKAIIIIIISCLIFGVLIAVFYPKNMKIGGQGGMVVPGEGFYAEAYSCFGIQRNFCPPWPDYGCDQKCYGIVYGKKCFIESVTDTGAERIDTACR